MRLPWSIADLHVVCLSVCLAAFNVSEVEKTCNTRTLFSPEGFCPAIGFFQPSSLGSPQFIGVYSLVYPHLLVKGHMRFYSPRMISTACDTKKMSTLQMRTSSLRGRSSVEGEDPHFLDLLHLHTHTYSKLWNFRGFYSWRLCLFLNPRRLNPVFAIKT
jgi:hypothetical protein